MPSQHAPWGGLHCSTELGGAEVFLAGSRPAGLCSLWPKPTSSSQDASGLSSCQEQGTRDMRHCPPPHHPEEPLGRATVSVLRAAEHPEGQQKNRLSKSGSVLPGKCVGRNAFLPVRAHWDSPGKESGPLPCSCQASSGPGQSWAWPLPPSQHSSGGKMLSSEQGRSWSSSSFRCPQGFCPQLLQSLKEAI